MNNLTWHENERGKWAWFAGVRQISGAYENECDKEYALEAARLSTGITDETPAVIYYEDWYSSFSKDMAKTYTLLELRVKLNKAERDIREATASHLRIIEKTASMQGNAWGRGQARNAVYAATEAKREIEGAIDIYEKFPQHAKHANKQAAQ